MCINRTFNESYGRIYNMEIGLIFSNTLANFLICILSVAYPAVHNLLRYIGEKIFKKTNYFLFYIYRIYIAKSNRRFVALCGPFLRSGQVQLAKLLQNERDCTRPDSFYVLASRLKPTMTVYVL